MWGLFEILLAIAAVCQFQPIWRWVRVVRPRRVNGYSLNSGNEVRCLLVYVYKYGVSRTGGLNEVRYFLVGLYKYGVYWTGGLGRFQGGTLRLGS